MPFLDSNSEALDNRNTATGGSFVIAAQGKKSAVTAVLPGAVYLGQNARLNTGTETRLAVLGSGQIVVNQGVDAAQLNKILAANAATPPPASSAGGVTDPSAPTAPGEATADPEDAAKPLGQRIADGITRLFSGDTEEDGDLRKRVGWVALVVFLGVAFLLWRKK